MTKSANGRERVIEAQGEPEIRVCYDEGGRMVAVEEDGKELLSQEWRQDGQLHKVEAKDQTASLAYDDNAVLKTITLHPPVEGTRLSEWQETLVDRFGRPVEVKDCTGLDLQMGYDDDGKLQALIQNTSNGNLGFSIERDQDGRVERIASSWGVTDYAYSDSGELYLVETTRNQKKAAVELAAGRITKQTSYDGGTTEFKYKSRGRDKGLLQSIECPNHLKLSNMYDSKGRIKQVSVGNVREVSIEYDNEGRIVGYCYGEK